MTIDEARENHDSWVDAYRAWPSEQNRDKIIELSVALGFSGRADWYMPAMGMLEAVTPSGKKIPLLIRVGFGLYKFLCCPPDRPGWNDYHMARWRLTGDRAELVEIHRRVHDSNYREVQETAQWMVRAYRWQNADFHAAMQEVESNCERCTAAAAAESAQEQPCL
jgi:hypothetical protein